MMTFQLAIDLYHDVDKVCVSLIESVGLRYSRFEPALKDPLLRWLDFTRRYIRPEPRRIEMSKRLPKALPIEFEKPYFELMCKVRRGDDVNDYQGRGLVRNDTSGKQRRERTDFLFADWMIHHLHITDAPLQKRSDWLLFVNFEPGLARFIDIRPHREDYVFGNHELIEAVSQRWPDFMGRFRVNLGVDSTRRLERELSPQDTNLLRRSGVTSFVEIDGKLYMPPGMGITSASTSGQTSLDMMKVRDAVKALATMIEEPNSQFSLHLRNSSIATPKYSLALTPRGLSVFEETSDTAFILPRENKYAAPSALTFLHESLVPEWTLEPLRVAIKRDAELRGVASSQSP